MLASMGLSDVMQLFEAIPERGIDHSMFAADWSIASCRKAP